MTYRLSPVDIKGLKKGIRILPGSDPLPFDYECGKAGSWGFALENLISNEYPAKDIKKLLMEPATRINAYGKLEKPFRVF